MAQLIVRRGPLPVEAATENENTIQDWDDVLHCIWLQKMADNPDLYLDAKQDRNQEVPRWK